MNENGENQRISQLEEKLSKMMEATDRTVTRLERTIDLLIRALELTGEHSSTIGKLVDSFLEREDQNSD